MVCESHHLDDLDDLKKYNIHRAYGREEAEVANLQYAAVLLRTVDLLHMTKDRTPSVMFRITNPTDPVSQREWRKQMGVNRVEGKPGRDLEGNVSETATKDTVEIHAFFTEAEPFFALSSFLNYVEQQLQLCHQWTEKARLAGSKLLFPWRWVDREQIEAKGFLSKVFAFELDQPKILNLLTGHTLYDNSTVVIRELVQNSIDAVKLQRQEDLSRGIADSTGRGVTVKWVEPGRLLIVEDAGTGMTQEIIEAHLLKVGSSRYATEKFREQHPNFFPISRFGIGILTAFMVADEVDIFTCHPDEAEARHVILRNLHGKYLIKLLSKADPNVAGLAPHGTRIELRLRPSAKLGNVEEILRMWVVLPDCKVSLELPRRTPVSVGHASMQQALEESLARAEIPVAKDGPARQGDIRVFSEKNGFAEVAFACKWSEFFQEWEFLTVGEYARRGTRNRRMRLGTCVEGIRVEFGPAGYARSSLAVMVNASGDGSPRTNVARSGLESTNESRELNRHIYECLFRRVRKEIEEVKQRRHLSATGALAEGKYLLAPLLADPTDGDIFNDCVKDLPLMLIEQRGVRKTVSPRELEADDVIWTIDCPLFSSAETLLRNAESDASLSKVIELIQKSKFPKEPILCRVGLGDEWALGQRRVDAIIVDRGSRRVDLRWRLGGKSDGWKNVSREALLQLQESPGMRLFEEGGTYDRQQTVDDLFVAGGDGGVSGVTSEVCLYALERRFFVPGTICSGLVAKAIDSIEKAADGGSGEDAVAGYATLVLVQSGLRSRYASVDQAAISHFLERPRLSLAKLLDIGEVVRGLNELGQQNGVFDPYSSERRKKNGSPFDAMSYGLDD